MVERPTIIPSELKLYDDWNYPSWFFEFLSDRPPLARQGKIGDKSIEDLYLAECYDIAYDMADDWPGYPSVNLGFFFLLYKKEPDSLNIYKYGFQIGASGFYEQFRKLQEAVNESLKDKNNLEVGVGNGKYTASIVLPSKESREIQFNFKDFSIQYSFNNLDYELLKQELNVLVP